MNESQKNFRKQIKQGLDEVKKQDEEKYYNLLKRNHLDDPEQRLESERIGKVRNGIGTLVGGAIRIVFGILFIVAIYSVGQKLLHSKNEVAQSVLKQTTAPIVASVPSKEIKAPHGQEIVNYLNAIRPFEEAINQDVGKKSQDVDSFKKKLLTEKEYIENLKVYKNRLDKNLDEITKINCPEEVNEYIGLVVDMYGALRLGYKEELLAIQSRDNSLNAKANEQYGVFNGKGKEVEKALGELLDGNGIRH